MIKTLTILLSTLVALVLFSFVSEPRLPFIGTYGVGDSDPSQIRLTLNEDHSYAYCDFSDPTKKINVNGTWMQKGKTVVLSIPASGYAFHNKWTFDEKGRIAKSRKGLSFYRLCRIEESK